MTLTCRCGSKALQLTRNDSGKDSLWERYRCLDCGAKGSQTLYSDPEVADERTGCIA